MRDQTPDATGESKMRTTVKAEATKALDALAFSNSVRYSQGLVPSNQRIFWVGPEAWVVNKYGQVYRQGHSGAVQFDLTRLDQA